VSPEENGGLIDNQRSPRDYDAAEPARRYRSPRDSAARTACAFALSVAWRTSSRQASALLLDQPRGQRVLQQSIEFTRTHNAQIFD